MHRIENQSLNEQSTDNESDINLPGTSKVEGNIHTGTPLLE